MKTWTIGDADAGKRLDAWLAPLSEIGSRGRARTAVERGKVFLNGEPVEHGGVALSKGDEVSYWEDRPGSSRRRDRNVVRHRASLRVLYEDEALVALDKPPGLLVEPLPGEDRSEVTLLDLVADHLRRYPRQRPNVVHRIDRDTSGVVLFAKTADARDGLKTQFERHLPERLYIAVVHGQVTPSAGTWRDWLAWDKERLIQKRAHPQEERAREAVARYRVLEQLARAAVLEVSLVTGKRNQIRVQAGSRGHPLVGERLYGFGRAAGAGDPHFGRQALHAATLAFRHPLTGRATQIDSPLPDDLRELIERLRSE
jgi:23S rRNA pseudouridine1911/1915/1917 synthase